MDSRDGPQIAPQPRWPCRIPAMHIFDVFEAWLFSMKNVLGSAGVTAQFQRSPVDRPNPSCTLNMRCGDQEIELSLWAAFRAAKNQVWFSIPATTGSRQCSGESSVCFLMPAERPLGRTRPTAP